MYNHSRDNKWVFKKHTSDINNIINLAFYLKNNKSDISKNSKKIMYENFKNTNFYNPRQSLRDNPLDAINHKLDGLKYFMFGYSERYENKDKFIFSPLGNLFLSNLSSKSEYNLPKIFITMLMAIQYPHPSSNPSKEFNLYPFRLIFKLLLDKRLDKKLFHFEIVNFVIFQTNITHSSYEKLIIDILEYRSKNNKLKFSNIKKDEKYVTKSVYEWQYYIVKILSQMDIIETTIGKEKIDLYHPVKSLKSKPTKRIAHNGYVTLNNKLYEYVERFLDEHTIYEKPLLLNDPNSSTSDIIKEIYSFYPNILLEELNMNVNNSENEILKLPKLIEKYSLNPNNETSKDFEDVLLTAFEMFYNVDAHKLSGSGNTDIECIFLPTKEKFAIEAKSTSNKLSYVNAGRLNHHRNNIGAKYTLLITPKYVPSVRHDIKNSPIVIIKANTFAEYLYNSIISEKKEIDYSDIHKIVIENYGTDISLLISELTISNFGI